MINAQQSATAQGERHVQTPVKLELKDIGVEAGGNVILSRVSAQLRAGEVVTVVGPSGCGKTTLLNMVAGLIPYTGSGNLEGAAITGPGSDRTMVFQEDAVFPWMTVQQNVEYGLKVRKRPPEERRKVASEVLGIVGLSDWTDKYPRQLSGGMRKRVDLARALATGPEMILMDEPYAALDQLSKTRLQEEFLRVVNERHMTALFVTHDLEEAIFVGDTIWVMAANPGRIKESISVPFDHPRNPRLKLLPEFQRLRGKLADAIGASEV